MGAEATCICRSRDGEREVRALLEMDHLLIRGQSGLKIAFSEIRSSKAEAGVLTLERDAGPISLELGPLASKWAEKIANPRTLVQKLGVKPGTVVVLDGSFEDSFRTDLVRAGATLQLDHDCSPDIPVRGRVGARMQLDCGGEAGLILLLADEPERLSRLQLLRQQIRANGCIWVVHPKGGRQPTERMVMDAIKASGLVDVKVARFSDTHSAQKAVIPLRDREGA
jgi:hypothetical protein